VTEQVAWILKLPFIARSSCTQCVVSVRPWYPVRYTGNMVWSSDISYGYCFSGPYINICEQRAGFIAHDLTTCNTVPLKPKTQSFPPHPPLPVVVPIQLLNLRGGGGMLDFLDHCFVAIHALETIVREGGLEHSKGRESFTNRPDRRKTRAGRPASCFIWHAFLTKNFYVSWAMSVRAPQSDRRTSESSNAMYNNNIIQYNTSIIYRGHAVA
jgi:hypothetical protein